jgi:fumarate hydratase class II
MTAAQEAGAWRQRISDAIKRLEQVMPVLEQLPLGGTAVGTGLNSSAEFAARTVERLAAATGFPYRESPNRFALIASREECLQLMGALDGAGAALEKIAEDLRLLVSGPRTGLGEYRIPEVQPGSSIMPGKINPVISEMVSQTAACVSGKYTAVRSAAVRGPLQLNIMQPLIAYEVLESIALLSRATQRFTVRCITGLMPNAERCAAYVEQSLALVTSLAPRIGYDLAARVARLAAEENLSVREAARRESGLDEADIDKLLDAGRMAGEG